MEGADKLEQEKKEGDRGGLKGQIDIQLQSGNKEQTKARMSHPCYLAFHRNLVSKTDNVLLFKPLSNTRKYVSA